MRHIHASQINPVLRQKHLADYRARLRDSLHDPALSVEQREALKVRIDALDRARQNGSETQWRFP